MAPPGWNVGSAGRIAHNLQLIAQAISCLTSKAGPKMGDVLYMVREWIDIMLPREFRTEI
jgi:hypothetical protein